MMIRVSYFLIVSLVLFGCKKKDPPSPPPTPAQLTVRSVLLNGVAMTDGAFNVSRQPVIRIEFSEAVGRSTVSNAVKMTPAGVSQLPLNITYESNDAVMVIQPSAPLPALTRFNFSVENSLKSAKGGLFISTVNYNFTTQIDSSRKFPVISDQALLTLVQQQTFKYFWDFAHPVSGLARERNSSGDVVTIGGSGFGVMAIVTGTHRGFITRQQGLARMQTIVGFLKNNAQKFKGAFPHWMNGITGVAVPFSAKDNGADLVETSFLMMGLLTARQYFDGADVSETNLRNDITGLYNAVEWSWFRKNNENVLYWHWSPNFGWDMNLQIRGWNECLVTYVLAASSSSYGIPATVYTNGYTHNGNPPFKNGNIYYGYQLPMGENLGGPLFFAHYSFLGINPTGLKDTHADYFTQNKNHSLINYSYCRSNPRGFYGYSDSVWGLTASDIPNGYTASSPSNDVGVIAPTAALSSFPYTPTESMQALRFFYYVLGDKLWKEYGFVDAFSLKDLWFANSYLAIDQGPIIVMIENYRSGLLWNLFTSCPEVKNGMRALGFTAPYL
jgi:hypothetical protein